MKLRELLESKDSKFFKDLAKWYARYSKCISVQQKPIMYLSNFEYEDNIKGSGIQAIVDLVSFVSGVANSVDNGWVVRYINYARTPEHARRIMSGFQINFGEDVISSSFTYDLDTWKINFEFFKSLHKYIVKYCMRDKDFAYVYTLPEDSKRFKPEYEVNSFLRSHDVYDYYGVRFTDHPIVEDDWIRIRNDMGFLVDKNAKTYI